MRVSEGVLIALVLFFSRSIPAGTPGTWRADADFDRWEGGKIHFRVPSGEPPAPVLVALHDFTYLGMIEGPGEYPYVVALARPCAGCRDELSVYLIPTDGTRPDAFVQPGSIIDPKKRTRTFEARAFFGHCLEEESGQLVVFQQERVDRRKSLQSSVLVVKPGFQRLEEKLYEKGQPSLSKVLKRAKRGICSEIKGRQRTISREPLFNLVGRGDSGRGVPDDDDEGTGASQAGANRSESESPPAASLVPRSSR